MLALRWTASLVKSLVEEFIADMQEHPIDHPPLVTSAVYFFALTYFSVPVWKAAIVAAIVFFAVKNRYGRRPLIWSGTLMLFYALAVWIDMIPSPDYWRALARTASSIGSAT